MPPPNPRKFLPLIVIGGLVAGGWRLDRRRAEERSVLSGFFENQPTQAASKIGGRISKLLVKEGDTVKKGDPLAHLEIRVTQSDADAKSAAVEQSKQQLEELKHGSRVEEIARQTSVVAEAHANLLRLQNGPRPEEIFALKSRLAQAEAAYQKSLSGPRKQEIDQAKAAERDSAARLSAALRGLTTEERAQFKAREEAAGILVRQAKLDVERYTQLEKDGAISRQQRERAETELKSAEARQDETRQALKRADSGNPPEELEQARQAHRQSKAVLDLILAGSRPEDKAGAKSEMEAAKWNLRVLQKGSRVEDISAAKARLGQAEALLAQLRNGARGENIAQSEALVKANSAISRGAAINAGEGTIRAPIDGIVERVMVARGDAISGFTPIMRLADPADIWMRVYVPEELLHKVKVNDAAELSFDGVTENIAGYVESISTKGEFTPANLQTPEERGRQVFAVRIRLRKPDSRIKAGMYSTVKRMGNWP